MDEATSIARRAQRQAQIMRCVNVPMRHLLALPFATPLSRQLMLLNVLGRKTGRLYRQPISYVPEADDTLLTPGGGRWTRNLRPGQPVVIHLRGKDVEARAEFIAEPDHLEPVLKKMMEVNPRMTSFMPFMDHDHQLDRTRLQAAVDHGFKIVRWHLADATEGRS